MTEKNKLQLQVNERIERFIDSWNDMQSDYELSQHNRLFTCSACYFVFVGYADEMVVLLQSYNTVVAAIVINGKEKRGYDFLRHVYGYTSTSAQHISKFFRLFSVPYTSRYTWRYVKGVKKMIVTFICDGKIYTEQADRVYIDVPFIDAPISKCAAQLYLDGHPHFEINLTQVVSIA